MKLGKRISSLFIALCITFGAISATEIKAEATSGKFVILDVPWELINQCGHQAVSGPCQAYSFAYCRTILDGKLHRWTEYWTGTMAKHCSAAGYSTMGDSKKETEAELLKVVYDNINMGRPIILQVKGYYASFHYVVAIGYHSDCNPNHITKDDILILDPANKSIQANAGNQQNYTHLSSYEIAPSGNGSKRYGAFWTTSGGTQVLGLSQTEDTSTKVSTFATISEGVYTFTPQCAAGSRLDINGGTSEDRANAQIYHALSSSKAQKFKVTSAGGGYYTITCQASGKALDVDGANTSSGTNVQQYTANGTDAQKWAFELDDDGYYRIIPKVNTGLCLDVNGRGTADHTNVQVYTRLNSTAQRWKLTAVDASEASTLKISPTSYPTGTLTQGSYFSIKGTVQSNYDITSVKGEIIDSKGNSVCSYTQKPNTKSFSFLDSQLDYNLSFNKLEPGSYYLKYTATDASSKKVTWKSAEFSVQGKNTSNPSSTSTQSSVTPISTPVKWTVTVPAGQYVSLYNTAGDSREANSIFAKDASYQISCRERTVSSDGTIYYRANFSDTRNNGASTPYWFQYEGEMTVSCVSDHTKGDKVNRRDKHPHYDYYRCSVCHAIYTDNVTHYDEACETCNPPSKDTPSEPSGHWGDWSGWSDTKCSASSTRQVETRQVEVTPAHTEYRYGNFTIGGSDIWDADYGYSLGWTGSLKENYTQWSTKQLPKVTYYGNGDVYHVFCGSKSHNHKHVAYTDGNGYACWYLYREDGTYDGWSRPYYYWEETRTVEATYKTQYRYRDWVED